MQKYVDYRNREISLEITGKQLIALKRKYGISLDTILVSADNSSLPPIISDIEIFCNVISVCCGEQYTPEEIADGLRGDSFGDAINALTEEIISFFPMRSLRESMRRSKNQIADAITTLGGQS